MVNTAKNFTAADALKSSSKSVIQKTAERTGNLIGNKISDRIMNVSKYSQQNNLETATNENERYRKKERYISPEERQEIVN